MSFNCRSTLVLIFPTVWPVLMLGRLSWLVKQAGLGGGAVVTDSELEGVSSIVLIFTEICLGTFMFKKP